MPTKCGKRTQPPAAEGPVLNPAAIHGGEPVPLDQETMERWFALVEQNGGHVYRDFVRTVGGLTFSPLALDGTGANQVARFNPLRALRPMPTIRPRPRFGTRSVAKAQPPGDTSPVRMAPRSPCSTVASMRRPRFSFLETWPI
jgi:hypothetical protein